MSRAQKHLALFSALAIVSFSVYYFPAFFYAFLIVVFFSVALYCHNQELLPARLGLNPRTGANIQTVPWRWFWAWGVNSVSVPLKGRAKINSSKTRVPAKEGGQRCRQKFTERGIYRREVFTSDSFLFSPRDFLMGSYIAKAESPPAISSGARALRNPREQLRENLSKPNYAVYTPNRRLSFTGEPLGSAARFTITPQRHYPLQQQGASPVGVLAPVSWDGFRHKNILSPRNTTAASPVTVKIARPDCISPSLDNLWSAVFPKTETDPCSRESVLKVLKESRKREVEDEDQSFTVEQKSKRRRNDSGGSAQSAFEPLLPNGTSTQLIPKPGTLKRGLTSASEDMSSSVSSGSGVHALTGTPSTRRNPIFSSYSSSQGISYGKRPSTAISPLSSPGSSRSQTPEGVSKKIREEHRQSPSSMSSVKSDHTTDRLPVVDVLEGGELSPYDVTACPHHPLERPAVEASAAAKPADKSLSAPTDPATTSTGSADSGGKRKRKIQLVSREDHLSLPPPPELGYSICVKDLDEEKITALNKIQKILERPALEPGPASCSPLPSVSSSSAPGSLASIGTSTFPSTTLAQTNLLLECLRMKSTVAANSVSAVGTVTVAGSSPGTLPPAFSAGSGQASAAVSSSAPDTAPKAAPDAASDAAPDSAPDVAPDGAPDIAPDAAATSGVTTPLLASGFKPIFNVTISSSTTATESKTLQNFKPIFGSVPVGSVCAPSCTSLSSASTASTPTVVGTSNSSASAPLLLTSKLTAASQSSIATSSESCVQPLFGGWSTPSTSNQSSSGSPLQFGAALTTSASISTSTTATSTSGTFSQNAVTFDLAPSTQSTATALFGGFGNTATTAQSTFTFGKSSSEAGSAQSSLSSAAEPPKAFTFGVVSASSASNSAPFSFGKGASTTPSTFGTPAKPTFAFSSSAVSASVPSFGAMTVPQSSSSATFTFSSAPQQPPTSNAQPTSTPFKFGAALPCPQFGTPVVNNAAPLMGTFTFGAADKPGFGTSNPLFGQSNASGPIPFGSPGTSVQGFTTVPFGSPATPSFSIGSGSKPSATRQRLQARRQHNRKK